MLVESNDTGDSGGVSLPSWLGSDRLPNLSKLKANFPGLFDALQLEDNSIWSGFARGQTSEEDDVPIQIGKRITPFQRLLAIQAIRPENLASSMENFAQRALHLKELSPPALSLKNVYLETTNR